MPPTTATDGYIDRYAPDRAAQARMVALLSEWASMRAERIGRASDAAARGYGDRVRQFLADPDGYAADPWELVAEGADVLNRQFGRAA